MAKTSKGVILSQASQIKSDYSFALIKATADNKSLVQDTSSAELKVNALVEYSKDSQWDPKKLTNLGFPAGCFLIVDLRGQDIHAADLITNLALVRQYGYQAGVIDDLSTLNDIKALKANQIYLINSGKTNDDQDASLNGNEITDGSGKLAVGMSVKWQRDYTNVDVSGDHAGFVGMGQDTLLKGGNAFGYSTNGRDFNAVITPKGLIFRRPDAERMWRLLKPNEIADINSTVGDKVKKEVDSATAEIPAAVSAANSAVSAAESAIAASKVNSDAIVAQSKAISEAKSAMDSATAEIQQTAANAASDAAKIRADVAQVQSEVDTAKAANSASVEALKSDIGIAKKDLAAVSDSLTKVQAAVEQNHKALSDSVAAINSDIASTNDQLKAAQSAASDARAQLQSNVDTIKFSVDSNVASIASVSKQLDSAQASAATAHKALESDVAGIKTDVASNADQIKAAQAANDNTAKSLATYAQQAADQGKTIKTLENAQDGFEETIADVQGNVSQVSDNVDKLQAGLTDTNKNVATVTAKADSLDATLTDQAKSIANITATATSLQATLKDAQGRLSKVETTAGEQSTLLSDLQGDLTKVSQKADSLSATLTDAQKNITQIQTDAKGTKQQITDLQGNVSTLQTSVSGMQATIASHDQTIHTLQVTASSLDSAIKDAKGNLSTLQQRADSLSTQLTNVAGQVNTVKATADSNTATIASVNNKVDNIQVGGTNLVTNTSSDWKTIGPFHNIGNECFEIGQFDLSLLSQNDAVTISFDYRYQNMAATNTHVFVQSYGDSTGWNNGDLYFNGFGFTTGNTSWVVKTFKFTLHLTDANVLKNTYENLQLRFDNVSNGAFQIRKLKVEKGNVATDWSPAPKDVNTSINQVKQTADSNTATISNLRGTTNQLKQTLDSTTSTLTNAQKDISQLQQTANGFNSKLADHDKNIATLQADSKSLHSSMTDAQGRLSKVEQTASAQSTTLSTVQGDLSQVKQTATNLMQTMKDAQGNISQLQQSAKGTLEQLTSAQGDITAIQKSVDSINTTIASHDKSIHTLQADSKSLKDSMADAQGNISSLQKTATSVTTELKDHAGRISKVEQTATEHTSELADTKGNLDKVTQKADNLQLLLSDAQKNIQNIQLDAKGLHDTLTGQSNQLASLNVTLNNLDSKYSGITGDLQSKQTALSTEQQQTKDMLLRKADKSEVDNVKGTVNQVSAEQKTMADQINQKVSSVEYQTLKDKVDGMKIGGRNLLHGTSDQWVKFTNSGWGCFTTAKSSEISTAEYHTGDTFTYSATICNNGKHDVALQLRPLDSNKKPLSYYNSDFVKPGQQNMRVSCTASVDANSWYLGVWVYFPNNDGSNDNVWVKEEQLEEGNVRTPWTPNPDDTIASIQKNATAIDENSKLISLMAKQTEVDNVKNTAQQISSRLDILAGEVKSKVDETRVNNIVDSKGYATTSIVQSLVDQKAGTLNESITNLEGKFNSSSSINLAEKTNQGTTNWTVEPGNGASTISEVNINGVRGVRFTQTRKSTSWWVIAYQLNLDYFEPNQDYIISFDIRTSSDVSTQGAMLNIARVDSSHAYLTDINFNTNFKANQLTHVSRVGHSYSSLDKSGETFYLNSPGLGQCDWVDIFNLKIARGKIDKGYSPAPSDNATVTQLQSVTASIDGLQSRVTNYQNDTTSKYTQLSNVIQSKVSASDFNDLKDKTLWKSTDSIDLNTAVSQQKIFVKGGSNLPPGDYWWYVQVESGYDSQIVQYAVSDRDNIHYSRQYDGSKWSAWSQGATESEITQLRDDINLRVKIGDLLSQINLTAHNTLIQSNKIYLDSSSTVFSGKAFIPSAAIVSLDADKINTGTLNTQMVSIGDDQTRLWARSNYLYLTGKDQGDAYNMRIGGDKIEFVTTEIPNGAPYMDGITPMYQIAYDGDTKSRLKIRSFNRLTGSNEFPIEMYDSVNISKDEIDLAANNQMKLSIRDDGVHVRRSLFFENSGDTGVFGGFTRADNSNIVEFSSGDNNGENFRIDCGARFMQYVYINGNARAQSWLTNSTLSKKTNIRKLDQQIALDKIRQDDQYLYEYKRNIEQGIYDPQASFIIDDVNDVSHYSVPREFIDQSGNYREPNVELAYLIAAFQAIDKQVQKQKEEIKELKEKLQHE